MSSANISGVVADTDAATRPVGPGFGRQVSTMVRRNLTHIKRQPENLTDVTIQPIMFVVLFAYVFGGAISAPGGSYREWLLPGIMAQTMTFAAFIVAAGLSQDLEKGIVDRFRSLPISRASVLVGRSVSSIIHSMIGIIVMSITGLFIGWKIHGNIAEALGGYLLLLGFGFAMIWIGILVGSALKSVEAVNGVMFVTVFPVTFLANTFAPPESMPTWLRTVAEWNPISAVVQGMRELWGNAPAPGPDAALPLQHPVIATIIWVIALTAVLAPLSLRAFNRRTSG